MNLVANFSFAIMGLINRQVNILPKRTALSPCSYIEGIADL